MNITIKSILFTAIAAIGVAACNNSTPENTVVETGVSGTMNADLSTSKVSWKGNMVNVYFHSGTLSLSEGTVSLENGNITGGKFVVDMKSMTTTDNNYDSAAGHLPSGLIGHLSSKDFFLVDSFPTATFTITSADSTGVTGDLTIKGMTNSEKIQNVVISEADGGVSVKGTLTFDRTKYGVIYQKEGGEMILSNDIELEIELNAKP